MRVHLCGVRGSTPTSGVTTVGVGANTSCLAVAHDGGPWRLILDGGTGLVRASSLLGGAPFHGSIVVGHLHIDHTQGLPFFAAGDRDDARVTLYVPEQGTPALELMSRVYSPPHFPITLAEMRGEWTFATLDAGTCEIEGFRVTAVDVAHPGGRTLALRVEDGARALVYVSDHGPDLEPGSFERVVDLARDADVLVHDSQFSPAEQERVLHYGHSTPQLALQVAEAAGARRLVLFHHAPNRADADVDALAATLPPTDVEVIVGKEGIELVL